MPQTLTASLRRGRVAAALLPSTSVGRLVLARLHALGDAAALRGPQAQVRVPGRRCPLTSRPANPAPLGNLSPLTGASAWYAIWADLPGSPIQTISHPSLSVHGCVQGKGPSQGASLRSLLEASALPPGAGAEAVRERPGGGAGAEARWQVALAAAEWALFKDSAAPGAPGGAGAAAVVELRGGGVELRLPVDEARLLQALALALAEACTA